MVLSLRISSRNMSCKAKIALGVAAAGLLGAALYFGSKKVATKDDLVTSSTATETRTSRPIRHSVFVPAAPLAARRHPVSLPISVARVPPRRRWRAEGRRYPHGQDHSCRCHGYLSPPADLPPRPQARVPSRVPGRQGRRLGQALCPRLDHLVRTRPPSSRSRLQLFHYSPALCASHSPLRSSPYYSPTVPPHPPPAARL